MSSDLIFNSSIFEFEFNSVFIILFNISSICIFISSLFNFPFISQTLIFICDILDFISINIFFDSLSLKLMNFGRIFLFSNLFIFKKFFSKILYYSVFVLNFL